MNCAPFDLARPASRAQFSRASVGIAGQGNWRPFALHRFNLRRFSKVHCRSPSFRLTFTRILIIMVPIMVSEPRYRKSDQRRAVLAVIKSRGGHSTADQIYEAVRVHYPRVSLGTVYRNLRILCDQGEIREVNSGASYARFELAGPRHYHLVCRKCGDIEDCAMPVDKSLEERMQSLTAFRVEQHRLEFIGLCCKCQSLATAPE